MRPTLRVLARYLEAGTPTGLTGVWTHGTPRSTLLYLYGTTLSKLQSVPESSLYRQSVEAVTKHRMEMVEKMVPPGYSEWVSKAQALLKDRPTHFKIQSGLVDGSGVRTVKMGDRVFIVGSKHEEADVRGEEWDGEPVGAVDLKDVDEATMDELRSQGHFQQPGEKQTVEKDGSVRVDHARQLTDLPEEEQVQWEEEPQLTADQYALATPTSLYTTPCN